MRETSVSVFTFEELSEKAKEKAREYGRSFVSDIVVEDVSMRFRKELQELGYPTDDVEWSLSYSQGDGMAFYGTVDQVEHVAERVLSYGEFHMLQVIIDDMSIDITISRNSYGHHYSHYNTMNVEIEWNLYNDDLDEEQINVLMKTLEEAIQNEVRSVSRKLEQDGYSIIEDMDGDEYLTETFEANEIEFTEDGEVFR